MPPRKPGGAVFDCTWIFSANRVTWSPRAWPGYWKTAS